MRVLLAMLGARRRYIVPEIMEELRVLGCFVTDVFVGKHRWVLDILGLVGRGLNIRALLALDGRRSALIPAGRVVPFQWLGLRYAIATRFSRAPDAELYASINRSFCLRAVAYLRASDVCWAYNGAAQELFEAARARNIRCVLEQVIAPRDAERREIERAAEDWPAWRSLEPRDPAASDSLALREQEEWRLANLIVAGSRYVQDCLAQAGVPRERCMVVPSGIDLRQFVVGTEVRKSGPLRVLFAGQVNLRKGAPYLLEAVRQLNSQNIELKMVGSVQSGRDCINEFSAWATLSGPVPPAEMTKQYHWADILVAPSVCEGSAMVTYEARSCGLPIIVTPNAGAAFSPGIDGLEIPVRDVGAIAEVLDKLARSHNEVRRLRDGAIANRDALGRDAYRERIRHVLETIAGDRLDDARPFWQRTAAAKEDAHRS